MGRHALERNGSQMALIELRYSSNVLGKMTGAMILSPEREDLRGPFPVFYLLHGLSDDYSAWMRRSTIERHVENLPLLVVMPDGGRGWYTDAREGFAYDTAIAHELVSLVDRTFHTDARREARVIGGLSMGGYGALKLALAHPDLFCSAVSHSGALLVPTRQDAPEHVLRDELRRIFGTEVRGGRHDLQTLVGQLDRDRLPALRIDCGTEDALLDENRQFHARLEKLGIPHEYAEYPGNHDWNYWDLHVQEAIAFHLRVLAQYSRSVDLAMPQN